jgi:hypothetical protein
MAFPELDFLPDLEGAQTEVVAGVGFEPTTFRL